MIKRAYSRDLQRPTQVIENSDGTFTPTVAVTGSKGKVFMTDTPLTIAAGGTETVETSIRPVDYKEIIVNAYFNKEVENAAITVRYVMDGKNSDTISSYRTDFSSERGVSLRFLADTDRIRDIRVRNDSDEDIVLEHLTILGVN